MASYPPLRFGIMCDGHTLALWERNAVERLLATPGVSLELLIIEGQGEQAKRSLADKARQQPLNRLFWNVYSRLLYKPAVNRRVSIADWVSRVPSITCVVQLKGKFSQYFAEQDLAAIDSYQLDFVLRFAFNIIRGKILEVPRYGVWSFHHDDEERYRGAPPGFWEIYHRDPVNGAILQRLTNKLDGGVVLKKGFFRTKQHDYTGSINMIYDESAYWPAAICRQLQLDPTRLDFTTATTTTAPIYYPPTNGQLIVFFAKLLVNKLRKIYEVFFQAEAWNMGVIAQPIQVFLTPERLQNVAIDTAPLTDSNLFYADCFGQVENGQAQIYFELFDYRTSRGNISRLSYPWRTDEKPVPILDLPFHLSYPYLMGSYCMPESAADNQVARYDLRKANLRPEDAQPLLPGVRGVDSTIIEHEGRYWMFYTRVDRDPDLNLFVAYADQLEGPWQQHPQNPVKTDVRSARPAGTPFRHNGKLYRPAQDFSRGYGSGIVMNEVQELTPTTFTEQPSATIPSIHPHYPDGMHTVAAIDDQHTIIDFKRHVFVGNATLTRLRKLITRR